MNHMLMKHISILLIFALALATVAPPRVFAQTQQTPATLFAVPSTGTTTKPDLKESLAAAVAKIRTGPLTAADIKRIEQQQQNQQSPKSGWSRKQKMFLALWIVVMTGFVVVLIKHHCRDRNHPEGAPAVDKRTDYKRSNSTQGD